MTQPDRRRTSKYDILETFATRVAELGYDQVSFSMVAKELGLSKGTIVYHFDSKEKILEAVHREYMIRRLREARVILQTLTDPRERVIGFLAQLMVAQRDDKSATVAFAREIVRFASMDVMHEVRVMRREYFELVRDAVQEGMDKGVFRADDAHLITLQIFGMCNWTWTWRGRDAAFSVDEVIATWSRTLLIGITNSSADLGSVDTKSIVRVVETIMSGSLVDSR
jgi:AcrR family transcriptional regulator